MMLPPLPPEQQPWPGASDVVCAILCGGKGSRLFPRTLTTQKSLLEVAGQPILWHVLRFWSQFSRRFVFVVKHNKDAVIDYVRGLGLPAEFREPENLTGIADGIHQVRDLVGEKFIVVLGDCLCTGRFDFPQPMQQAVGVVTTEEPEDIRRSYSVELEGDRLAQVVEKPVVLPNNLCGTGFYFFDRRVFDYIERVQPSAVRNEKEITDVLQLMIDAGETISAARLHGGYVNINLPPDLLRAEAILTADERFTQSRRTP